MEASWERLLTPLRADQLQTFKYYLASFLFQCLGEALQIELVELVIVNYQSHTAVIELLWEVDDQLCKPIMDGVHLIAVDVLHHDLNLCYDLSDEFQPPLKDE